MSWAKSRTILRRMSLSSSSLSKNRHMTIIQLTGTHRRQRSHYSHASTDDTIFSIRNSGSGQRHVGSSGAFFSTVPSSRELLDDDESYDTPSDLLENHNPSWKKRDRRKREDGPRTPIATANHPQKNHADDRTSKIRSRTITAAQANSSAPPEYEERSTIDRIVSSGGIGEYQSVDVDSVVTEDYLERLFDNHVSTSRQPPNPNMLLNMLELLHNEETHISNETVLKLFREVVGTKRVKLLERAEAVVVKNRYDPRLLRLLVTGYVNAGAPRKACDLLIEWPNESIQHQPGIESYRRVLAALGTEHQRRRPPKEYKQKKRGNPSTQTDTKNTVEVNNNEQTNNDETNYHLAHRLLQHMCRTHAKFPELKLAPDRDCFHRVLAACSTIESLTTAKTVLEEMKRLAVPPKDGSTKSDHKILDTLPNVSTTRVIVGAWTSGRKGTRATIEMQKEAFAFLRNMEEEVSCWTGNDNEPCIVDIDCYNVLLNVLAENGRYELAESLFLRLLTDYLKGEKSDLAPDTVTLNTVLKAHVRANTEAAALSAEKFLERLDHFFDQQQRLRKERKDCPDAPRVAHDIQPTARARSAVSNLWIHLGRPHKAIETLTKTEKVYRKKEAQLRDHQEHHPDSPHVHNIVNIKRFKPDQITYRQIVGGLSKLQDPPTAELAAKAEDIAERMCEMGHRLNLLTCNTILNCWTKSGNPHRAEAFLEEIMQTKHKVIPDIVSYNTIIHGYARLGNLERALELLTRLLENSLQDQEQTQRYPKVNVRTFTSILIALSKEHTVEAAEEAERLLLQMQELNDPPYNLNTRPNNVTYNAVMNCWASLSFPSSIRERRNKEQQVLSNGSSNSESKRYPKEKRKSNTELENEHHRFGRKAEFVLRSMQNLGADEKPNTISYNIVIRAYSNDVEKAEELIQDMIQNGLEPTDHTYKTLVHVLNRDYRITDKDTKLRELVEKYFPPSLKVSVNGRR